jgi:hypothetical protein
MFFDNSDNFASGNFAKDFYDDFFVVFGDFALDEDLDNFFDIFFRDMLFFQDFDKNDEGFFADLGFEFFGHGFANFFTERFFGFVSAPELGPEFLDFDLSLDLHDLLPEE